MLRHRTTAALLLLATLPALAAPPATQPASQPGPVYTQIVDAYMLGHWEDLDAALRDKSSDIAALPPAQADDIRKLRQALFECRPAWWNQVKAGKKILFHPSLFGHTFAATYDPACKSAMQLQITGEIPLITVNWPANEMDSADPGERGFAKGDLADLGLFATLGAVDSWVHVPAADKPLDDAGKLALARYLDFRGNSAGLVYANPPGRRWGVFLFLVAFTKASEKSPVRQGREAMGALVMQEILMHPDIYKSFPLPKTLPADGAEQALGAALSEFAEKHSWTLAEDMALRSAARIFAANNSLKTYDTGEVILPNKLPLALSPEADTPLRPVRDAWIKEHFDKLAAQRP